ncbi:MAG: SWIM zinc finger family protein [Nodosilinea sp.]
MAMGSTLLYSAAAVRRILGLSPSAPVQQREFFKVVWVWVKGQRPTFISKAQMKAHFVARRRAEARSLQVVVDPQHPCCATVINPATGSQHRVTGEADRIACDCEDYHWQVQGFGRGCCKHGYAVLAHLGYDSLGDYQAAQARPAQPTAQAQCLGEPWGQPRLALSASRGQGA